MKILLVIPYQNLEPYILPNLGLGYIATALRNKGHNVTYLDCLKEEVNIPKWKRILLEGQYDLVGIQTYSYTLSQVKNMLKAAKETLSNIITVVGGPQANSLPGKTLSDNSEIDYVIHGEGEKSFPDLIDLLERRDYDKIPFITNLAWRDDKGLTRVNRRAFIENLDELGVPAWDLMDPMAYPKLSHGLLNRAHPIASLLATRGCPYSCVFCSAEVNMGSKIRKRSPSKIVDEIAMLVKEYGVREIHFEDDNFTFYKDFACEVCQLIVDRKIKVFWACPNGVRLDSLDADLLRLMERSGCYSFALGIESGSDRVLKMMKKGTTADLMRRKIRLVAETTKIRMTGFFMFGFPGETEEDLRKTEKLVLSEPLHRISVVPFIPYPGTPIYKKLVDEKKISEKHDWTLIAGYGNNAFVAGSLSKKQLLHCVRLIHLRFYLRPSIIVGILSEIHSFRQLKVALKELFKWLGILKVRYSNSRM